MTIRDKVLDAVRPDTQHRELAQQLVWNDGGTGYGLCAVAGFAVWAMSEPKHPRGADDLRSIVAVSGPPEKYTVEELEKLVAFSERRTAHYDTMFRWRLGANLIFIDKMPDGRWYRKRQSWTMGVMSSDTLDEAMAVFERD